MPSGAACLRSIICSTWWQARAPAATRHVPALHYSQCLQLQARRDCAPLCVAGGRRACLQLPGACPRCLLYSGHACWQLQACAPTSTGWSARMPVATRQMPALRSERSFPNSPELGKRYRHRPARVPAATWHVPLLGSERSFPNSPELGNYIVVAIRTPYAWFGSRYHFLRSKATGITMQ